MLQSYVKTITPEIAAQFLGKNTGNRSVSRETVRTYSQAIQRGEWMLNGEPIVISSDGKMLNGQHRCHAVIAAKSPIDVLIVEGVSASTFSTFDGGKKRSGSDVLGIAGFKNTAVLQTGARGILCLEGGIKGKSFSNTLILDVVRRHPGLPVWANRYAASPCKVFSSSFIISAMTLAEEKYGIAPCEKFWIEFSDGVGLAADNPAYHLRERFIGKKVGTRMGSDYSLALCVKAVSAAMNGRPMGLLRWGSTEDMPSI